MTLDTTSTISASAKSHLVNLGDIKVSKTRGESLVARGLGSCIGLCLYDSVNRVAGMAHIVLPLPANEADGASRPGMYAKTAVPALLNAMQEAGADISKLIPWMAGGAQMQTAPPVAGVTGEAPNINVGLRNIIAVKAALKEFNILPTAARSQTGGNQSRTIRLDAGTGNCTLQIAGHEEKPW